MMRTMLLNRSIAIVILLAGTATASAFGAESRARRTTSLNGEWQFIVDQFDCFGTRPLAIARNRTATTKSERVEHGFSNRNVLQVPSDWNTQSERLFFYEGTLWYKKDFIYHPQPGRRTVLSFGAVNYAADVYLNGALLGSHVGGFTPFAFDCTGALTEGKNLIVVRVNNERTADRVPGMDFDWWNFGGITRDVTLMEYPETFIDDHALQLRPGTSGTIDGWVRLNGTATPEQLLIALPELGVRLHVPTQGRMTVPFSFTTAPVLWTPESPKLYDVGIAAGSDTVRDRIGFRTVAARGTKILLNGREVFLRGICMHDEAFATGARITTRAQIKALFEAAKRLHCNFVRLAHYPHRDDALRLADEMGLLVWAEVPVWQNISFTSEPAIRSARQQLREMITRDKNRASIIFWSVSNETNEEKEGRTAFITGMISLARSLDSTRMVTMALHRQAVDDSTMRISDPVGSLLDVIALNEYIGWYQGVPKDCGKFRWETAYDKPHIISEFGAEAVYGFHADNETMWSEEFQAEVYTNQLAMIDKIPFVAGIAPWILKDFRSPRRLNPDYQNYWNNKGLLSNDGHPKRAFDILREFYLKKDHAR